MNRTFCKAALGIDMLLSLRLVDEQAGCEFTEEESQSVSSESFESFESFESCKQILHVSGASLVASTPKPFPQLPHVICPIARCLLLTKRQQAQEFLRHHHDPLLLGSTGLLTRPNSFRLLAQYDSSSHSPVASLRKVYAIHQP